MRRHFLLMFLLCGCGSKGDPGPAGPTGPSGPPGPSPSPSLVRTVIVSPVTDDINKQTENGNALLAALAGITASGASPVLLELEPGQYDLGNQSLEMKAFVDIEGSGQSNTTIGSTAAHTIEAAENAQLRFVSVIAHAKDGVSVEAKKDALGFSLTHVTLGGTGGGISITDSGAITMDNVEIYTAGGAGISCSAPTTETIVDVRDTIIQVNTGSASTGLATTGCILELDGLDLSVKTTSGAATGIQVSDNGASAFDLHLSDVHVQTDCTTCTSSTALQVTGAKQIEVNVQSSELRSGGGDQKAVVANKTGTDPVRVNLANTQAAGTLSAMGGATFTCIGVYDSAYAAVTCP